MATALSRSWRSKLITQEDPGHVHKCVGLLCLCSFAFRLSQMGDTDMAFRTHPELTVPTVLLHLLLNVSSFAFALPQQRIKEGTRMWPESRIHTLCFVSRSFAILLWAWFEAHVLVASEPHYWVNTVIVMANFVAVDYGSSTVKHRSQTIRETDAPAPLKFFFSMAQFWTTGSRIAAFLCCFCHANHRFHCNIETQEYHSTLDSGRVVCIATGVGKGHTPNVGGPDATSAFV